MSDDLSAELRELKDAIAKLDARVAQLESEARENAAEPLAGHQNVVKLASSRARETGERQVVDVGIEHALAKTPGLSNSTAPAALNAPDAPKMVLSEGTEKADLPAVTGESESAALGGSHEESAESAEAPAEPSGTASTAPVIVPSPTSSKGSLESRIGQIWLNRIGIASLVIGMAFLLMYSFQYFGAQAKLACGALISIALIALGEWTGRKKGTNWFGMGLVGGGWALAYFTTYASHFVQSVQVIGDATVVGVLMLATAAGAMAHAVYKRAQGIANLSIILAYITVGLTVAIPIGLVSNLGLLAATCALAVTMNWHRLLVYATVASYLVITPHVQNFSGTTPYGIAESTLSIGLLGVYWLAYMMCAVFASKRSEGMHYLIVFSGLVNALFFTIGYFASMEQLRTIGFGEQVDACKFPATLAVAVIYGAFSYWFGKVRAHGLSTLYMVLGIFTVTVALLLKFQSNSTALYCMWSLEAALLAWTGLHYQMAALRRFAYGLAAIVNVCAIVGIIWSSWQPTWTPEQIAPSLLVALVSILSTVGITWCYRQRLKKIAFEDAQAAEGANLPGAVAAEPGSSAAAASAPAEDTAATAPPAVQGPVKPPANMDKLQLSFGFYSYFLAASAMCWFLPLQLTAMMHGHALPSLMDTHPEKLNALWWAVESAVIVALGIKMSSRFLRILGLMGFVATVLALLILQPGIIVTTVVAGMFFAMSWLYHKHQVALGARVKGEKLWALGGIGIMTLLLPNSLPANLLAPYWAVEGLVILVAGFRLRDKSLRISGLIAFLLLIGKLLLVDLAAADTLQRIISFIVAGLVLLASSYGYAQFSRKLDGQENTGS
jgi:uncharacterized membrane protein